MDHSGHVAVVTGAAQGIGREYARALAEDGAQVVVADINRDGASETAELIDKDGGTALAIAVDVSDRDSTLALAEQVRDAFGATHIVVNNAAIYHSMRLDPVLEVDIDYWRRIFSVNLDGALLVTQAFAPLLIDAGWGRVVNQTSVAAYGPAGAYSASKLALINLTISQAAELGPRGVTVNAIAPGPIFTEATEVTVPSERLERMLASAPINKRAEPRDLVGALRFLCSDDAAWITGQTILVDGGITRRI
ncbi:MAG: SDR family oxidoreductase [Actinobacteria bacterium]|nr:SDR family oxidoreductase [Actinomycetota bacterium]